MTSTLASPPSKPTSPDLWPSYGKLICKWIEATLVHGEGDKWGEPFRLRVDQRLFLYNWYEYEADAAGNFVDWRYSEALLEFATGWGKTEIGAALALVDLAGPVAVPTPNIPVAAASYEQADLLLGRARQIVTHDNCKLRPFIEAYDTEILLKGKPGRLFRIAAVAGTNEGGIPTTFMADELHEWTGGKERIHVVVRKSLRKRHGGRTVNMTTPGHDLDTLAGRMHEVGVSGSDPRLLHVTHFADPSLDLSEPAQLETAIRQANPWKSDRDIEALVLDFAKMPEHEFRRYHLCQWVPVPADGWLEDKPGAWEACEGPAEFSDDDPVVMWIDMSLSRDTTSVGRIQARADGRKPVATRVFDPANSGGKVDYLQVRQFIRDEAVKFKPKAIVYDPRFLEFEGQQLEDEGLPMVRFDQSPERMAPACGHMYDQIVRGEIEHPGDPILSAHVLNAVKRQAERGFTLSKGKSKGPIDACVGMVMAGAELENWEEVSLGVFSLGDFLDDDDEDDWDEED